MTPEEKAKDIISSMYEPIFDTDFGIFTEHDSSKYKVAKQCALIAVDEILNEYKSYNKSAIVYNDALSYWDKVKQEIEKL